MLSLKLTELFFVVFFCAIIFANAYKTFFDIPFNESLYASIRIQTLAGSSLSTESGDLKILMCFQYVLAYFITSGIIIFSFLSK